MIDPHLLRDEKLHLVEENLRKRKYDLDLRSVPVIAKRKKLILTLEEAQHRRNILSKEIGQLKSRGETQKTEILKEKVSEVSNKIKQLKEDQAILEEEYQTFLLSIPNLLDQDVPSGDSEKDNRFIKQVGGIPRYDFEVKPHYELAQDLDLIDFERGVKLAGSRFYIYNEKIASLERNLINMMLNIHSERGYLERSIPLLVKDQCLQNTGQLPKFRDEYYHLTTDQLNLIPTGEVPLTNIYQDEILSEEELPVYLCSATSCFRREAGAAGRDTRGIIRVHQFQKVELVKFVKPEESDNELKRLKKDVELILQKFSLTYRIMLLCAGDTGFSSAKTYDFEVWFPGSKRWVEISSCSNFKDFQSRRAKIRFKDISQKKNRLVHTLNGSGVAAGRLVAALMEYNQTSEGMLNWEAINDMITKK